MVWTHTIVDLYYKLRRGNSTEKETIFIKETKLSTNQMKMQTNGKISFWIWCVCVCFWVCVSVFDFITFLNSTQSLDSLHFIIANKHYSFYFMVKELGARGRYAHPATKCFLLFSFVDWSVITLWLPRKFLGIFALSLIVFVCIVLCSKINYHTHTHIDALNFRSKYKFRRQRTECWTITRTTFIWLTYIIKLSRTTYT